MELKIDPKNLQRSTNTNFDEDIAKRNEKKDNMIRIYWNHVPPKGCDRFADSVRHREPSPGEGEGRGKPLPRD